MKRKIAAILAADAAEYSRLVAENEEEALRQLVASVEVFKASIAAHGGRVFNTAGDAVLAEFQSAVEAVRSALDIQGKLAERNRDYAPGRRMMFRMGISIGDVVENDGDLLGDGVNIAARLQTLSLPGGLAISRWVQEQVAGKVPVEFSDAGHQSVKNMPAPIHVFRSVPAVEKPVAEPPAVGGAPAPRRRSPAMLALTAASAALSAAAVLYVLGWNRPGEVAVETPPAVSERPEPVPAAVRQEPETEARPPAQQEVLQKPAPEERLVPQASPPATETAVPSFSPAPLAATPPASETAPPSLVAPPSETQPPAGLAAEPPTVAQEVAPTPIAPAPVIAQDALPERKPAKKQCAEILERAQLGDLSPDDREFLRSNCR